MIARIIEISLRYRAVVLLGALALLAAGLWSAFHLPIDAVPDITGVQVQVNTEVPALAAEESEKLVTQPIELEMAGLPGMEEMRSLTKFGLSQVTLNFKDGTDIYRARQLVTERLQGVLEKLPPGAKAKLAPISTGLGEIFYYSVSYRADTTNKPATELEQLLALSEIQEYTIKPLLRAVPGIAEINESGGYERQFVIQPKPDALEAVGMTFSELAALVAQNVRNEGGGIISRGGQQLTIRAVSRVQSADELAELPLKFGAGVKAVLVKDVADVKVGTKFRTGAATLNGKETVIGTTMMLAGQNSREVAERVKKRIVGKGSVPECRNPAEVARGTGIRTGFGPWYRTLPLQPPPILNPHHFLPPTARPGRTVDKRAVLRRGPHAQPLAPTQKDILLSLSVAPTSGDETMAARKRI